MRLAYNLTSGVFSFQGRKKQLEREVSIRNTPFNYDLKTDTPLFNTFIGIN